jgi:hypothetical protein
MRIQVNGKLSIRVLTLFYTFMYELKFELKTLVKLKEPL